MADLPKPSKAQMDGWANKTKPDDKPTPPWVYMALIHAYRQGRCDEASAETFSMVID